LIGEAFEEWATHHFVLWESKHNELFYVLRLEPSDGNLVAL
jgi:hypothetical protein